MIKDLIDNLRRGQSDLSTVKFLLKKHPELINSRTSEGESLFDFALANEDSEMLEYLLKQTKIDIKIILLAFENNKCLPCKHSDNFIHCYKPKGRRPSFYVEINKNTGESVVFNKKAELGSGNNGCVVDFMSDAHEHRAVKYFDEPWIEYYSHDQVEEVEIQAQKEADLRCRVYPAPNVCFFFSRTKQAGDKQIKQCGKRDILDFIDGESFKLYYKKVSTLSEIVNLFLLMIQEIKNTPGQGVIHGDIKEDNIMITSDSKVKLIDFGQAQLINGEKISTLGDPNQHLHIAPECFRGSSSPVLVAAVTQDIYSLGYMLRFLYNYYNPKFDVNTLFPSIKKFFDQALDITPANRPNLDDFYTKLTDEYHAVVMPLPAHSTWNCV